MPTPAWRKILISGSNAHVHEITSSGIVTTPALSPMIEEKVLIYNTSSGAFYYTGSYGSGGGGGGGSPGGSDTQIQFNDGGAFAGTSSFTFNKGTFNVVTHGSLIASGTDNVSNPSTIQLRDNNQDPIAAFLRVGSGGSAHRGRMKLYDQTDFTSASIQLSTSGLSWLSSSLNPTKLGIGTENPSHSLSVVGDISASGYLNALSYYMAGTPWATATGGDFFFGNVLADTTLQGSTITLDANITASGDISSSGALFTSTSLSSSHANNNVLLINTATGELYHTGSYGSGGGGATPTLQQVMTEGATTTVAFLSDANISSSADIEVRNITSSGDISSSNWVKAQSGLISQDLSVVSDIFIGDSLTHYGDTSTKIGFTTDAIFFSASEASFTGAITSSGAISASGTIVGFNLSGTNTGDQTLESSIRYLYSASTAPGYYPPPGVIVYKDDIVDHILINTSSYNGVDIDGSSLATPYSQFLYSDVGSLITSRRVRDGAFTTYKVTGVTTAFTNPDIVRYDIANLGYGVSSGSLANGDEVEFIWDQSAGVGGGYSPSEGSSTKFFADALNPGYNYIDVFFGGGPGEFDGSPAIISSVKDSGSFGEYYYVLPAISHSQALTLGAVTATSVSASGDIFATSASFTGPVKISLATGGTAFEITEEDKDQKGRLLFEYENGDPTLTIASRASTAKLHIRQEAGTNGLYFDEDGQIYVNNSTLDGVKIDGTSFSSIGTNTDALDLGKNNRPWKDLYLTGDGANIFFQDNTTEPELTLKYPANSNRLILSASDGHPSASFEVLGDISASNIIGTLSTVAQGNITSVGTLGSLTVSGDITANGDIVGDDTTDITNMRYIYCDRLIHNGDVDTLLTFGIDTVDVAAGGTKVFQSDVTGSILPNVKYNIFNTSSAALSVKGAIGDIVKFGGSSTVAGGIYYLNSSGGWSLALADSTFTSTSSIAMAVGTNSTTDGMCLRGFVNPYTDPGAGTGNPVYMSDTETGRMTSTAPSSNGDVVRIVGHQYGTDLIYFNPSSDYILHA